MISGMLPLVQPPLRADGSFPVFPAEAPLDVPFACEAELPRQHRILRDVARRSAQQAIESNLQVLQPEIVRVFCLTEDARSAAGELGRVEATALRASRQW